MEGTNIEKENMKEKNINEHVRHRPFLKNQL